MGGRRAVRLSRRSGGGGRRRRALLLGLRRRSVGGCVRRVLGERGRGFVLERFWGERKGTYDSDV